MPISDEMFSSDDWVVEDDGDICADCVISDAWPMLTDL
jgi:hypothetical protein